MRDTSVSVHRLPPGFLCLTYLHWILTLPTSGFLLVTGLFYLPQIHVQSVCQSSSTAHQFCNQWVYPVPCGFSLYLHPVHSACHLLVRLSPANSSLLPVCFNLSVNIRKTIQKATAWARMLEDIFFSRVMKKVASSWHEADNPDSSTLHQSSPLFFFAGWCS